MTARDFLTGEIVGGHRPPLQCGNALHGDVVPTPRRAILLCRMNSIGVQDLETTVSQILEATPFIDIHTHLFAPAFGKIGLWGIDELLTYHYLEAELFRSSSIHPTKYWTLGKTQRADLIWKTLFVENAPTSEATRGVIAVLQALGLDSNTRSLEPAREFFRNQNLIDHIPHVFQLAGIREAVMTNDPLDAEEAAVWNSGVEIGPGFRAALRIDRILNEWDAHWSIMAAQAYRVEEDCGGQTLSEVRRFLAQWITRMQPAYMAVSLPDSFFFPIEDARTLLIREAVLPACREFNLPMALMIGVRRQVNPLLKNAGDAVGIADLRSLENLCREFPDNRFLVTVLSRENQHELCVYARKFANILPFGCWWFLNNPSLVEEITRMRLEMLGMSFIPQHSDARVLEQVIYKWRSTRRTIAPVLANAYKLLSADGRSVTREDVEKGVTRLFQTNFERFLENS
jgi:hypothetical protein